MSLNKKKTSFIQKKRSKKKLKEEEIPPKLNIPEENKIGPWDESEDERLADWVSKHGPRNWAKCAKVVTRRTGKQCREHWNNKLNNNIKKGDWTSEDDLLILKFYKKYQSWKKIIPIFENRTENSIKNRFFSQLRKIAIKKKMYGKTDEVAKIKLETLIQFLDEAIEVAENEYFYENKGQTKEKLEQLIEKIDNNLKYVRKGKFIDLNTLRGKNTYNSDNNANNANLSFKNMIVNNLESNNSEKKINYNKVYDDKDSISFDEAEEEIEKKPEIQQKENIEKKKTYVKKRSKKESIMNFEDKNMSFLNRGGDNSNVSKFFDFPIDSNSYSHQRTSNFYIKVPTYNPFNFGEKKTSPIKSFFSKKSSFKQNNNDEFEVPLEQNRKSNSKLSHRSSTLKNKNSSFYNFGPNISKLESRRISRNISNDIESAKLGATINPCSSFS